MTLEKFGVRLLLLVALLAGTAGVLYALYVRPFLREMMVMKTIHYDNQLTIVTGGGGNSGIFASDSMVLVIDTKMDEGATALYDTVRQIAGRRPILVVNTHMHSDHTKGNNLYKGATILAGAKYDKDQWAQENGTKNLPTQWLKDSLVLHMNDETITILNLGYNAHTQSDVIVYLHSRQVLFTGDLVLSKSAPALFKRYASSSKGYLSAFDEMENRFQIKTVVPGHGDVGGRELIDAYRAFFEDMYVASVDAGKKPQLLTKYNTWKQIPFVMSPEALVTYIKKEKEK